MGHKPVLALWRRDERLAHDENPTTIRRSSGQYPILYSSRIIYLFIFFLYIIKVLRLKLFILQKDIYLAVCLKFYSCIRGPGSSVGIATDYGLEGPGSKPGGEEIFRTYRPALGPTQPPIKWVQCLSRGQSAAGACC